MSNWVRTIAEDAKGCIWIGSNLGIDKLTPAGKSFRVFNFSHVNNFFADIYAIFPESEHSLWFPTGNGLVNIIDGEMEKTLPLPIYITSVHLGDPSFNYNTFHADRKVRLKYFQNQFCLKILLENLKNFLNHHEATHHSFLCGWFRHAHEESAVLQITQ